MTLLVLAFSLTLFRSPTKIFSSFSRYLGSLSRFFPRRTRLDLQNKKKDREREREGEKRGVLRLVTSLFRRPERTAQKRVPVFILLTGTITYISIPLIMVELWILFFHSIRLPGFLKPYD